jgi:hypothetical protein
MRVLCCFGLKIKARSAGDLKEANSVIIAARHITVDNSGYGNVKE